MAKKYSTYWYKEPEFRAAALYNLRDDDVSSGGRIAAGEVVQGREGLAVAECEVVGRTGKTLPFKPNRRCEWQGHELPCMILPASPDAGAPAQRIGAFNYAVAVIIDGSAKATADSLKLPTVKNSQGAWLINVELTRFNGQDARRKAKLI